MKMEHVGYLAGFFDGEGHVGVRRQLVSGGKRSLRGRVYPSYVLEASMANTNPTVIQWVQEMLGGKVLDLDNYRPRNWKPIQRWQIFGHQCRPLLELVERHVIVKREHVALALRFLDLGKTSCPEVREEMYLAFRQLNMRGVTTRNGSPQNASVTNCDVT